MSFLAKWRLRKPADDAETVYVSEKFGVRSLHIGSDTIQSSMRLARPFDLELSYTRSMMGFLLFAPDAEQFLIIGLGGGSVAKFIHRHMKSSQTEVVEKNERVVAIARQLFQVPPDDDRFQVTIGDGADTVDGDGPTYDVILVDGYDADSHAEELSTRAFYGRCAERLSPSGILVVNLWGGDREFDTLLRRVERSFPEGTICLPAEKPGNVVVFGFKTHPGNPTWQALNKRAAELHKAYGLEFPRFVEGLRKMNPHDEERLLLPVAPKS